MQTEIKILMLWASPHIVWPQGKNTHFPTVPCVRALIYSVTRGSSGAFWFPYIGRRAFGAEVNYGTRNLLLTLLNVSHDCIVLLREEQLLIKTHQIATIACCKRTRISCIACCKENVVRHNHFRVFYTTQFFMNFYPNTENCRASCHKILFTQSIWTLAEFL